MAVEQSNHLAASPVNGVIADLQKRLSSGQGNKAARQQDNRLSAAPENGIANTQDKRAAKEPNNWLTRQPGSDLSAEPDNGIANNQGNHETRHRYSKPPLRAPTKDELEMVLRTGRPSGKMLLQEKVSALLVQPEKFSLQDFVKKCEDAGIHLLFNQSPTTGRISGITYFHEAFKIKGQALGNRFKWAELLKQLDYEQTRDSKAVSQANDRTRSIYGNGTIREAGAKAGHYPNAGRPVPHRSPAEPVGQENHGPQGSTAPDRSAAGTGVERGQGTEKAAAQAEPNHQGTGVRAPGSNANYWDTGMETESGLGVNLSDDIDDEAIHGRNRKRKQQARVNSR